MKIGFIFGNGTLPELLLEKYHTSVCALIQSNPKNIAVSEVYQTFEMTEVGNVLSFFKRHNVTHICFAGGVKKPQISFKIALKMFNFQTISLMIHLLILPNKGDNFLLNTITAFVNSKGFEIISATQLMPQLLATQGILTKSKPNAVQRKSINLGIKFLAEVSKYDISQACVVQNSCIIALEGIEGTKQMILRMKDFSTASDGAILVKMPKIGQNLKVDMPTIGIETIRDCIASGFAGVVIKAESTIVLNQQDVITLANDSNFFILSVV